MPDSSLSPSFMFRFVKQRLLILLLSSVAGCFFTSEPPGESVDASTGEQQKEVWILVDSRSDRMTVYRDGKELAVFDNIAFGAAGVKEKQRVGDDVTPRGTYTVGWIRKESKFVHFIGLNYPSLADAERGYRNGVIGRATFERIKQAIERGKTPPQDTPLGGQIGIHGVGRGSLEIHRLANWTAGCIAIEDHQIRRLARIVSVGMRVEIR
jgi:murein L,D-transpeptidase YafK